MVGLVITDEATGITRSATNGRVVEQNANGVYKYVDVTPVAQTSSIIETSTIVPLAQTSAAAQTATTANSGITVATYNLTGESAGTPTGQTETLAKSSEADTRLPASTAAPEYPYNNATVTRAGHEMHWDDTPGRERIRMAHRAGTYFEISEDGRKVELVSANEYKYIKGGLTMTIDKNGDIKVGGLLRLVVSGDAHVEINGDVTAAIGGSLTASVNKSSEIHVGENATVTAGKNITATADQNIYATAGQDMTTVVGRNLTAVVQGDSNELTLGNRTFQVGGEYKIVASAITLDATGAITTIGNSITTTGNVIATSASNTLTTQANTITSQANTISSIIPKYF